MVMLDCCVECGGRVEKLRGPVEWDVRGRCVTVPDVPHGICQQCGEAYFADGISSEVHRKAVDLVKEEEGLLTGAEIRAIRLSLGLSQARFEKVLGAGPKTVVRWENGTVFQNRTADTLMRVIRDYPQVAQSLVDNIEGRRS